MAAALVSRGWQAETGMGQSRFRCDVAVRTAGAVQHQVAILVDTQGAAGLLERFHTQPAILRAFGWQVLVVLAKDWWHEPLAVIERIEKLLRSEGEEEAADGEEPDAEPLPDPEPAEPAPGPEASAPPPATPVATALKRYEVVEGGSRKFWEIGQEGSTLTLRYGRLGTQGQTLVKHFPDEPRAKRELEKLTAEKLNKGYRAV